MMDSIQATYIKLQFDDFVIQRSTSGWSVFRGDTCIVYGRTWEEAFDSLTTGERVRAIVFANSLR
jgi:hypothetical protein